MKYIGIIPARYASTRFPGKPLADIQGKSMIRRVYEQASRCAGLSEVVVATDHPLIFDHVSSFGKVVMTSDSHRTGSDRCREAIGLISKDKRYSQNDVVINIQGDEPFIHPDQIELLMDVFDQEHVNIGSLMKKITSAEELFNENIVKVIVDTRNKAIYFSRFPIPFCRDTAKDEWLGNGVWFRHIGLYGFRIHTLNRIGELPESPLEKAESLEQLRWIEHGMQIYMRETAIQHLSIDTPADLDKALKLM
jgi:3-deoxy-manno-octulosonate cytidylyltransferase (CMP-KDO synthetase)